MKLPHASSILLALAAVAHAGDIHVSPKGDDTADGSAARPLKTISAAAQKAMSGDTVTAHAGVYREWVNPPRGGESDTKRIVYQAAPGEKVVITGSELVTNWTRVQGDTWKTELSNKVFGDFNPFAETISGDWFSPNGRTHHRGGVWIGDTALAEAANFEQVMAKPGEAPLWFAKVDGIKNAPAWASLFNIASFKIRETSIRASAAAARQGGQSAPCSEGGDCVGYIGAGHWLRHDGVDFGDGAESVTFRVSAPEGAGGVIELRLGHFDGPLLGSGVVTATGGWQNWSDLTVKVKETKGVQNVYLVFKEAPKETTHEGPDAAAKTEIYAQFPGADPNAAGVEIACRPTVFTPEKTGIDFITLRGFELKNAASNWAAPTAGQRGLVTAYWCKGWIIEDNNIHDSRCSGIALGKYSDQWDGKRGSTEGYALTIEDALKTGGWSKEKVGSHIVRRNHIHRCGQTGIVGGMGCSFSIIEGNDIHDIYWKQPFAGLEMACIKFHGAVDVIVRDNHLWRCGYTGLWLDWMTQGAQITGNLVHDCGFMLINMEVNHGPNLIANNILLGSAIQLCGSNGNAYVHNLGSWKMWPNAALDLRQTPFMKPHYTAFAGTHNTPAAADDHVFNNISAEAADWRIYDSVDSGQGKIKPLLPSWLAGNVYLKGSTAPACEADALALPQHDSALRLTQKSDGWYLSVSMDSIWKTTAKRRLVTTHSLGKSAIAGVLLENPDGSPLAVNTDYFGKKRDVTNPFPGPFETPVNGEVKVWPK